MRWGKAITTKEAITRAQTIVAQTVRENYRILAKTGDFTRLTTEACEAEQGVLACVIVDPKDSSILAPSKSFNKSITDIYELLAINAVKEGKEELVHKQKSESVHVVAQPIYLFSQDANDRVLQAIVLAEFEVLPSITSTFEPMVEAVALFGASVSRRLLPDLQAGHLSRRSDARSARCRAKGRGYSITCESRFPELESLAQVINFRSVDCGRHKAVIAAPISGEDGVAEDVQYIKSVEEFDAGTTDALLLLDRDKKVRFVGHVLEDLVGLRNQYAQGQNISDACRDPLFAGTAIDMADKVFSTLGEMQGAQLDSTA